MNWLLITSSNKNNINNTINNKKKNNTNNESVNNNWEPCNNSMNYRWSTFRIRATLARWRHLWKVPATRPRICRRDCRRARGTPAARNRPRPSWCASSSRPVRTRSTTRSILNGNGGCLPSNAGNSNSSNSSSSSMDPITTMIICPIPAAWVIARPCPARIPSSAPWDAAVKWPVPLRPTCPIPWVPVAIGIDPIRGRIRPGFFRRWMPIRRRHRRPMDIRLPVWVAAAFSRPIPIT